jgi:glucose-1-phosphate cytidylyltransferase
MTGGRLARVKPYLNDQAFCFTYGDGVADIDINALMKFHQEQGKLATLTAVQPPGRYGALGFDPNNSDSVVAFQEKPEGDGAWINGGFFVLEPKVIDYIREGDKTTWERAPLDNLANDGQLNAYRHRGFWRPMDTLRDKTELETLWASGKAPWKSWT